MKAHKVVSAACFWELGFGAFLVVALIVVSHIPGLAVSGNGDQIAAIIFGTVLGRTMILRERPPWSA